MNFFGPFLFVSPGMVSAINLLLDFLFEVVLVRSSENICSRSGGALRKKERQYETQFTTKIDGFLSFRKKERQDETQFTTKIDGFSKFHEKGKTG
jgi:hypothetical protein